MESLSPQFIYQNIREILPSGVKLESESWRLPFGWFDRITASDQLLNVRTTVEHNMHGHEFCVGSSMFYKLLRSAYGEEKPVITLVDLVCT